MKIDYSKVLPITIGIAMVTILTLSCIWYGVDRGAAIIIGLFVAAGIAIGIDKYITWKQSK